MSLSINGQSQVPPGFRFHPTEEELLHHYLRKKVAFERIDLDVIREVDLNKLEPWDIQGIHTYIYIKTHRKIFVHKSHGSWKSDWFIHFCDIMQRSAK